VHELSIALSIVDGALEEAERRSVVVKAVHLRVGPLSGVDKEALQFAYPLACEGTLLQGTELIIQETAAGIHCAACNAERPLNSIVDVRCPVCGDTNCKIVRGSELEITALEVADAEVKC
jgi:hydrogenase nickel incorporation protein HypA/HybF